MNPLNQLELLSPAKNADIGRQAILHGADAVYIGGPAFGARAGAGNSVQDIEALVRFAHLYHARIFATLNTILHESELACACQLAWQLYEAGADALIIQDMGLLEMDLPPIALHASTQCDIRTPEKAHFLSHVGFSQIVLARELSLPEIKNIAAHTSATVEFFIHGALCVAFSGQCYISHAHTGRSANRGDCSQACRLPYTLKDNNGRVVAYEKHLLSMKDNDQSANLCALVDAGVRSFKIEGRYKDMDYVKNITAHYRQRLDEIIDQRSDFSRSSSGQSQIFFTPDPQKTFHRGATDYFIQGRQQDIGAFESPKFIGLPLGNVTQLGKGWFDLQTDAHLANGDGLTYLHKREVMGFKVNLAEKLGELWRIYPQEASAAMAGLKVGTTINRNLDHTWEATLLKQSAQRRIALQIDLTESKSGLILTLTDEDGISVSEPLTTVLEPAQDTDKALNKLRESIEKMGNTIFYVTQTTLSLSQAWFVPVSTINALRRAAVEKLEQARLAQHPKASRTALTKEFIPYPDEILSYLANVYNSRARIFYEKHGVKVIAQAYEAHKEVGEVSLMITKHCLRHAFELCPKQARGIQGVQGQIRAETMTLTHHNELLTLKFDCRACEMHVVGVIKKNILQKSTKTPIKFVKKTEAL